jgi:hypothetical protein
VSSDNETTFTRIYCSRVQMGSLLSFTGTKGYLKHETQMVKLTLGAQPTAMLDATALETGFRKIR